MTCSLSRMGTQRKKTTTVPRKATWRSYLMEILSIRVISIGMLTSRTEPFSIRYKLMATSRFPLLREMVLPSAKTKCKPFWSSRVRETSEDHRLSKLSDLMVRSIITHLLIRPMWVLHNNKRPKVLSNSISSCSDLMWESPTAMRNGSIRTTTSLKTFLIINLFERSILTWFVPETTYAIAILDAVNNYMNIKSIWISFTKRTLVFYSLEEVTSKEMMTKNEWPNLRSIRDHPIIYWVISLAVEISTQEMEGSKPARVNQLWIGIRRLALVVVKV